MRATGRKMRDECEEEDGRENERESGSERMEEMRTKRRMNDEIGYRMVSFA